MIYHSKSFRLFISSTFSDFQTERETLQTKVFPEIKEYCSSKGYVFQPIDLRWGVSNEAQLDQKTLAMCIKEVQSCKIHHYPNFLIMLGDRYGWIPLPNIIEKNEFELITENVKIEDRELLLNWYYEDKNQIPVSYILKQRTDEYIDYDNWIIVESKLKNILQKSVENLDDNIINKYFTSATEAEAIEGIISYFTKTEYQKKLLKLIPELSQLDHKHIFGFFRDINKNTIISNKFIADDYEKAQEFKEKIKSQLIDENILTINTSQISEDSLDKSYLENFTLSVMKFLKRQIELQIKKDEEINYSPLEIEKQQQYNFLNQKLENFLGQEETLKKIESYINDENDKPLIICGKSGIGKSSIIAKVIQETSITTNKKIIYRFIGATPSSTNSKEVLFSILEELNSSLINKTDNENKKMNLIQFSDIFYNAILDIKEEVVILIDAVDQLTNEDYFLWLPNKLPSNIKIIISTLKDGYYVEDSKYFFTLEDKISNYIEIEIFNKPIELLESLLKQESRTLEDEQKKYFLTQYQKVNTPFYIYMAANEIQYWKSSDISNANVTLSLSQKDIVKNFIENLTIKHHHDKLLVQKIFGYILASKDGLSEYELLELLNTDKEFIKKIAPETWHTNTSQELPLAIWTRLHNHIKPLLRRKNQDGQELLCFFHREFIDAIKNQSSQQMAHENIIEATQKLILKNKDNDFDSNRWGKLYIILVIEYYLANKDEDMVFLYYDHILSYIQSDGILKYLKYIEQKKNDYISGENTFILEHLIKLLIYISKKYKELSDEFYILYINNLHEKARILIQKQDTATALKIEKQNLKDIKSLSNFQKIINTKQIKEDAYNEIDIENRWFYLYLGINNMIGFIYMLSKDKQSILMNKKIHLILKDFYDKKPNDSNIKYFYYDHINYYAWGLQLNGLVFEAIDLLKESLHTLEKNHNSSDKDFRLDDVYAKTLHFLAGIAYKVKDKDWSKYFSKSYKITTELLKYNFLYYSKKIIELNNYYIENYNANNLFLQSEPYYKNNIMLLNRQGKKGVEEKIKTISDELFTKVLDLKQKQKQLELFFVNKRLIEYVFNFEKKYWAKFYVEKLIALGVLLNKSKLDNEQLSISQELLIEGINICEQYMTENDEWYDLYTKNMNNLANTYLYLNKKDESSDLNIKNLNISTKLFQKDNQKWFRAYYYSLINMASTHMYNGDRENEKKCRDKIEELENHPSYQFIQDVVNSKSEKRKIQYFDYFYKVLLLLGAYFFIKYVFLE